MANPLKYHDIAPMGRNEAETRLASGSNADISRALISLAHHDPDWRWVQEKCFEFIRNRDKHIKAAAALCHGHLARIRRGLHRQRAISALREILNNPELAGRAQDALDDIETYLG